MEIKFRGKVLNSDKWVYGEYCHGDIFDGICYHCIDPETLGQYTNLKDKDGNEIYKDDLIQNESGRICKVTWHIYCWDAEIAKSESGDNAIGFSPPEWSRHVVKIGNVYENQELMEGEK